MPLKPICKVANRFRNGTTLHIGRSAHKVRLIDSQYLKNKRAWKRSHAWHTGIFNAQ